MAKEDIDWLKAQTAKKETQPDTIEQALKDIQNSFGELAKSAKELRDM